VPDIAVYTVLNFSKLDISFNFIDTALKFDCQLNIECFIGTQIYSAVAILMIFLRFENELNSRNHAGLISMVGVDNTLSRWF